MKHIKRIFAGTLLVLFACIVINSQTRFFKDIGTYIPFLQQNFPQAVQRIGSVSDEVNKLISHIPTPKEFIARIRNVEIPIDPDDVALNVYYSSDTMLNFNPHRNISVCIEDNQIDVYGITNSENDRYLVYRFIDGDGQELEQSLGYTDSTGKFREKLSIPQSAKQFTVFTGPEKFGQYTGYINDYIYLEKDVYENWSISDSPVYENNVQMYEKAKSKSNALKNTYDICYKESSITNIASEITQGLDSDYEKALAIHDWVCENIYYDQDSISETSNTAPYIASDVLAQRRAVCLGYANLYAAICRSANIPCNVVKGYALDVNSTEKQWNDSNINASQSNHAWNEIYIDNRWVIVDTTWDSRNKIENGVKTTDKAISHLYFDSNLKFFSVNHKILSYK